MLSLATVCMFYLAKAILAQQERVIYVLPEDQPLTYCPEEENCYHLTELINHDLLSGQVSNTTIALLPGTHTCTSAVNKTLSISNATNFALIAANSSEGTTIKCNGSIGFEFNFIINLTITSVVFTECGSYQTCDNKRRVQSITFTLFLNYSMNANINNVTITDGNGIGLILMNPQGQTTITHSYISCNNHGNIYVFSMDSKSIALSDTIIAIYNSNFTDSANDTRIGYTSCIPIGERSFGVQFALQHSRYHIHVKLINISVIQNNVNIYLKYTSFKTTVKIKGLKSIGKMSASGFISVVSRKLSLSKLENFTIIENSYFIGGEIRFFGEGKTSRSIMNHIFLSNVYFESSQKKIFVKSQNITLRNVTILDTLNGILIHDNSVVNIEGTLSFLRNKREFRTQKQTNLIVHNNGNFIFRFNNVNDGESPFFSIDSNLWFLANSLIIFENNTGSQSGGITFINTEVIFKGGSNLVFTSNRGKRGGAMAFYAQSHITFNGGVTNLTFMNNYASIVGGAIYVQDSDYARIEGYHAFFSKIQNSVKKPTFHFSNNTAIQAGDALYGGGGNANDIKFNNTASTGWSLAATTPFRICTCENSKPKCKNRSRKNRIYTKHTDLLPGQTFNFEVVAVGYWDGVVPANIHAEFRYRIKEKLPKPQQIQSVGRTCTNLSYTIFFSDNEEILKLQIVTNERSSRSQSVYIFLKRKKLHTGISL